MHIFKHVHAPRENSTKRTNRRHTTACALTSTASMLSIPKPLTNVINHSTQICPFWATMLSHSLGLCSSNSRCITAQNVKTAKIISVFSNLNSRNSMRQIYHVTNAHLDHCGELQQPQNHAITSYTNARYNCHMLTQKNAAQLTCIVEIMKK